MPHPQIQRAFGAWLDEVRPLLSQKVEIGHRTDSHYGFSFNKGAPFLSGQLSLCEVAVFADYEGYNYDLVFNADVAVAHSISVFHCSLCEPNKRSIFATQEGLWRDHLFDPLLRWVNDTLAPAKAIAFHCSGPDPSMSSTTARLLRDVTEAEACESVFSLA